MTWAWFQEIHVLTQIGNVSELTECEEWCCNALWQTWAIHFILCCLENCNNKSHLFTGEQNESICKNYITQIRSIRLQIEDCDSRTVTRIRQSLEKDPLRECIQKTAEQRVWKKILHSIISYFMDYLLHSWSYVSK